MVIYRIINLINGKNYVGKYSIDDPNYYGSGLLIKRAIKKYGKKNFKREVLQRCRLLRRLNDAERYWIKTLNTKTPYGYNLTDGGDGGDVFTNNPRKEEIRAKFRERKGEKNGMFGRHHSKKSIRKISIHKKGQRKGIPTWNAGLTKEMDERVKRLAEKSVFKYKGRNHSSTKKYIAITPKGKKIKILDGLNQFAIQYNLHPSVFWYVNKGIIPLSTNGMLKNRKRRDNLIGWRIKRSN